jgi:phospholipid/cholesterol/gamma-HCH transport system substrate-binding protein
VKRSTPLTWEQVRVGALLVVALVLLATGVFLVGGMGNVFGNRYRLVTLMESGAGLVPGSAVQVAGQNVGQVSRVEWIDPENRPETGEAVAVWLAVNERVRRQIRADSKARLRTQGLLGDRVVDIEPGSPDAAVLAEGDTLSAAEPLDYQEILEQASGAVTGLRDLTGRLEELTRRMLAGEGSLGRLVVDETLYRRLTTLSGSLADVLERAEGGDGALGQLLTDPALYRRLVSLTASLDTVTARVARGEGTLGRLSASDSLYREMAGTAERFNRILDRVESGEGTAGKLVTDQALYDELLKTLTDLNAVLADLRRDPGRYVPPVEVF